MTKACSCFWNGAASRKKRITPSPIAHSPTTMARINGMLCVVTEETDRLLGERRVETLRDVASALASTNTEDEVQQALKEQFSRNKKDLPFTLNLSL